MACELCQGTGYVSVEVATPDGGRTSYAKPCTHGRNGSTPAGGFEGIKSLGQRVIESLAKPTPGSRLPAPALFEAALERHADDLTVDEIRIARLIARRVGQSQAIRIADLIVALGEGWTERDIKAAVERLRRLVRLPIAATKVPPYGYFVPATAAEADECHDRLFGEGIRLIVLSQLFRADSDLVERLRGQLELGNSEL